MGLARNANKGDCPWGRGRYRDKRAARGSITAMRLRAGMTVGRYDLVTCIGQGAMGVVYEAVDRALGRRVAVKILHASPIDGPHFERLVQRFHREGRAAAQVHHAHVVNVFDLGVEDGSPFLVMELVDGESLAQLLVQERKLTVQRAVELLLPVLSGVAELHTAGIVHRDIKPANILLARGDVVCPKLADFGVSRLYDGTPSITKSGAMVGTPEYMAPELVRGGPQASEQSDQYSLGVTLYECIGGEKPFRGETDYEVLHAVVTRQVPPLSSRDPSVPAALDAVVMRAMHREPGRRFACVDELAEALLPFASEAVASRWRHEFAPTATGAEGTTTASVPRAVRSVGAMATWRRSAVGVVGVAVVGAVVAVVATVAMGGEKRAASVPDAPPIKPDVPVDISPAGRAQVEPVQVRDPQPTVAATAAETPPAPIHVPARSPAAASSQHSKMTGSPRVGPTAPSVAVPATASSAPARGEHGAPILDVP